MPSTLSTVRQLRERLLPNHFGTRGCGLGSALTSTSPDRDWCRYRTHSESYWNSAHLNAIGLGR